MILTNFLSRSLFLIRNSALLFIVFVSLSVNAQSVLLWSDDHIVDMQGYYYDKPVINYDADTEILKVTGKKNTQNGQRLSIVNYTPDGDVASELAIGSDLVTNNTIVDYKIDNEQNIYILQHEIVDTNLYKTVLQKYSAEGTLVWAEQIQDAVYSHSPISITLSNAGSKIFITLTKEIWDYDFSYNISQKLYVYDSDGSIAGEKTFDPATELEWISSCQVSPDGSVYLFGKDYNNYLYFKALEIDENGNVIANTVITQPVALNQISFTADNNFLFTTKINVSKITPLGELLWSGPSIATTYYEVNQVIQDQDGNIYVTGRHWGEEANTNNDILTTKYDSAGNAIWQNVYQYGLQNADIGNTIVLKNGAVYVGGNSQSEGISTDYDYVLLKIDAEDGYLTGVYRYNGAGDGDDGISSIYVFDNDNVAITGLSYVNSGYNQTTQLLSGIPLKAHEVTLNQAIAIWPNPAEKGTLLTINGQDLQHYKIVSLSGQTIVENDFDTSASYSIPTAGLSSGMYLLILESESGRQTNKILIR